MKPYVWLHIILMWNEIGQFVYKAMDRAMAHNQWEMQGESRGIAMIGGLYKGPGGLNWAIL